MKGVFSNNAVSRPARALLVAFLVAHLAPPAQAQEPSATDRAAAEALFREARQLLNDGETSKACEKFAASYRFDPALGALLNLALCHEQEGRTATAWAEFNRASSRATQQKSEDRARFARQRAAALELRLSRVVVNVGQPADRIEVTLDGTPLASGAWGSAIPMDPGKHTVEAAAPGRSRWSQAFVVAPGPATIRIEIPPLESEGSHAPTPVSSGPAVSPAPLMPSATPAASTQPVVPPAVAPGPDSSGWGRGTWGWAMMGLGAAGVGAGAYFGIRTFQQQAIVDRECKASLCNTEGYDADQRAHEAATISTIGFGVGAAAAGVGLYLILTDSGTTSAPAATTGIGPFVGSQGGGAAIYGAF